MTSSCTLPSLPWLGSPSKYCRWFECCRVLFQGSFCVCAHPMRDNVTIYRHFSLAGRIHKIIPGCGQVTTNLTISFRFISSAHCTKHVTVLKHCRIWVLHESTEIVYLAATKSNTGIFHGTQRTSSSPCIRISLKTVTKIAMMSALLLLGGGSGDCHSDSLWCHQWQEWETRWFLCYWQLCFLKIIQCSVVIARSIFSKIFTKDTP